MPGSTKHPSLLGYLIKLGEWKLNHFNDSLVKNEMGLLTKNKEEEKRGCGFWGRDRVLWILRQTSQNPYLIFSFCDPLFWCGSSFGDIPILRLLHSSRMEDQPKHLIIKHLIVFHPACLLYEEGMQRWSTAGFMCGTVDFLDLFGSIGPLDLHDSI